MLRVVSFILGVVLAFGASRIAKAGYTNFDIGIAPVTMGPMNKGGGEFTILGTKWEPGSDSASFVDPDDASTYGTDGAADWSIMGQGLTLIGELSGDFGADHPTNTQLITGLGVPGWEEAEYVTMIDAALDTWAAASGFTNLGQATDSGDNAGSPGATGDIRIAAWDIAEPGVLGHTFTAGNDNLFPGEDGASILGDMHIDTNWIWRDDPRDKGDFDIDIFTVVLHELGHALGLGHSTNSKSVMAPTYSRGRRDLAAVDIAGIQYLYGPSADGGDDDDTGGGGGRPPWAGGPNGLDSFRGPARQSVPEPGTLWLLVVGIVPLLHRHRAAR